MTLSDYLAQDGAPTTADLARRVGVTSISITRYAAGKRLPSRRHMIAIAEATGHAVTANDFFGIGATVQLPSTEEDSV